MKAKTLRNWPHVHMNNVSNPGPDANGWYTFWVLWGPYVGQWSYRITEGTPRLRRKDPIGRSWAAGTSYLRRFPAKSWNGKTTWKHVVSAYSRNSCTILHEFLERQEELVEEKSERYVRSVLQYRMKEALQGIPEWALKLYRRHKMLNWDIIALNPSQEFWTWLEKEHKGQVTNWAHLMENLNMKKCSPENFYRKLHCRGITNRAIQEALEDGDISHLRYRMGGLTIRETKALNLALGWKLCVSDFKDKKTLYKQYQQVLDSYDGSLTKEQYNCYLKLSLWATRPWGSSDREIVGWEESPWGGFATPVYEHKVYEPDEEHKLSAWAQKHFQDKVFADLFEKMFPGETADPDDLAKPWWVRLWRFTQHEELSRRILDNENTKQLLELMSSLGIEYEHKGEYLKIKSLGDLGSEIWYKLMLLSK